jgi:hypothetical protein
MGEKTFLHAMKITKSPPTINSFGGINFVIEALKRQGILQLIENQLGARPSQADYSYSEVLLGHYCATLCGAERLEDAELLRPVWCKIPGFRLPSSDTTGRVLKSLSVEDEQIKTDNALHRINSNPRLNRLLLEVSCHLGVLKSSEEYVLDYDNLILDHEKFDSQKTYKFNYGSQPGVALIGKTPVYIEGRTGNSPAKFRLADTLKRTFDLLDEKQIKIRAFRSDSAAYQKEVFELVEQRAGHFYIRMRDCAAYLGECAKVTEWRKARINYCDYEVASIAYTPTGMDKPFRVVVYRVPNKSGQINLITQDSNTYLGIITNDWEMEEKELIEFYNQRGAAETNFDVLNNDFNWSRLPFSDLCDNTVFLIMGAICKVIYQYIIETFSKTLSFLKPSFRLKNFLFHFMIVPAKWIRTGGRWVLKLFTDKPYENCLE